MELSAIEEGASARTDATRPCDGPAGVRESELARCRERYLSNIGALYRADAELAAAIDGVSFGRLPALERSRDGQLTCQVEADDGRPIYIHSKYRTQEEARALVDSLVEGEAAAVSVSGMGLGYHVGELDRRFDNPLLIVAENDLALIKAAFCCVDVSRAIAGGRLVILSSADKATMHERLYPHQARMMLGMRFVTLPHAKRRGVEFQSKCVTELAEFVTFARLQMMTIVQNSRVTCRNIAMNLGAYLAHPGIDDLRGRARGYPGIVVAAGPSLARALPKLAELRKRAVVVAVQTVFKPLLEHGSSPHFVASLDFAEVSANFFRGVEEFGETTLVAEPKATWHVLDAYGGRKRLVHSRWADDILQEAAPARAAIKAGSTVAQLAFYLAQHLGCDPIILVGLDLAYSEGLYYAPGMPIERTWGPELGRYCTLETKQWERVCRGKKMFRRVKDIHGRDAYTDEQLLTYAQQFQSDFLASESRVIHAGESGMRLEGTEVMALEEAAREYCVREIPKGLFETANPGEARGDVEGAKREMEKRVEELRGLREIFMEMKGLLERLEKLADRPSEFNRLVVRVDELRNLIQQYDRTYGLVVGVSPTAELRRLAADRRIGDVKQETARTARMRLARDRDFVEALIDGCEYLMEMLPEAARRLKGGER